MTKRLLLSLAFALVATLALADSGFAPYEVIFRTDTFVESVKYFETSTGVARVACITSAFGTTDDYKLYVFELNSLTGSWIPVNRGGTVYDLSYPGGDALTAADMNGDGKTDIIVGHKSGLSIFLASSTEDSYILQRPVPIGEVHAVLTYDVNADGKMDVISLPWQYETLVSYGDGRGGVSRTVSYPGTHEGWNDMKLGNVDSDPELELIVMSGQGFAPNFTIYDIATSGLVFESEHYIDYTDFVSSNAIAIGDTNDDGRDDIELVGSGYPEHVWEYRQDVSGVLPTSPFQLPMAEYSERAMIAPVGCDDTLPDLVVIHGIWIGVYHQQPFGLFSEDLYPIGTSADHYDTDSGFDLGDADKDGLVDVFITNHNMGLIWNRGTCSGVVPDTDGDTVPDNRDCAPSDSSLWGEPQEVTGVRVTKSPVGGPATWLLWDNQMMQCGPGVTYNIAGGLLSELWADRGFARAYCDGASPTSRDDTPVVEDSGSRWWLVRAVACGPTGTYGTSFRGPDAEAWLNQNSPCP